MRILRLAVLVGVALSILLGATPVAAGGGFITEKLIDTISDFAAGTFLRTSLINLPNENISAVQLLPVGLTGNWVLDNQRLQVARQDCGAAAYGPWIYVVGGRTTTGQFLNSVERLTIGADGAVTTRSYVTALPKKLSGLSAFVHTSSGETRVYAVGGAENSYDSPSALVYSARIEATGLLSPWRLEAPLEYGVYYGALAVRDDDIYLVGGIEILQGQRRTVTEVARADIDASGVISTWIYDEATFFGAGTPFPLGVAASQAVAYRGALGDTLFVIGGRANVTGQADITTVAYADIHDDGSLGPWVASGGSLLLPLHGHGSVVIAGDEILLTGGRTDPSHTGLETSAKAALVEPERDGYRLHDWCELQDPELCKFGSWQSGFALPDARAYHGSVRVGDWIYVIGGGNNSDVPTNTIYRGTISGDALIYAPDGVYESPSIEMGGANIVRLAWEATTPPGTSMVLEFATCTEAGVCTWDPTPISITGNGVLVPSPALTAVPRFRYRLSLTGIGSMSSVSPRFERLHIYYDANPPDLAVTLTAAAPVRAGGGVAPGDTVRYSVDCYNTGGVAAQGVSLTVQLPAQLTFQAGPGSACPGGTWQALGGNTYGCAVGTVAALGHSVPTVQVGVEQIPQEVEVLVTTAQATFPPMTDLDVPPKTVPDPRPGNNSAAISLPAIALSLAGSASANPPGGSSISPGQQVEYRLDWSVSGRPGTAVSGAVIDAGIDPTKLTNIQPLDGGMLQGNTVRWYPQGALPPGYTGVARFLATVRRPLANGTAISVAFRGWSAQLPTSELGRVSHSVIATPLNHLSIAADSGATAQRGQLVTYTFTALNDGGIDAVASTLSATLDPALIPVSTTPPASISGSSLVWSVGGLPIDTPVLLKVTALVADTVVHGQLVTVSGTLSSTGVPDATATLQQTVSVPAVLVVEKVAEPAMGFVRPGGQIPYRVRVTNAGGGVSQPVALTDTVPSYTRASGGESGGTVLRWSLPALAGGESAEVSYQVTVDTPLAEAIGQIVGGAAAASDGTAVGSSQTTTTSVQHWPNLWVRVSDGQNVARPGQTLAYTVTFGNYGGTGTGAAIVARLSADLQWLSGSGWQATGDGGYRYEAGTVAQGAPGTASFQVKVLDSLRTDDPTANVRVDCTLTHSETDGDPYDNLATDIDITKGPDLAVQSISVDPGAPNRWQSLTFRIQVANLGTEGPAAYATLAGRTEAVLEVYLRPAVSAPPSGPKDHLGGYCLDDACNLRRVAFRRAIPVSSLGAGASLEITFPYLCWTGAPGVYDVYAQIDVDGDAVWGGFKEGNELNNVGSLRRLFVSDADEGLIRLLPSVQLAFRQR